MITPKRWISIEIDLRNWDITKDSYRWQGAESLVAEVHEGETFERLLECAQIFFSDQDGGEAGSVPFDGSYLTANQYDDLEQELACRWARVIDERGLV